MKEQDIRPDNLFQKYLELSAQDASRCFTGVPRTDIACVACNGTKLSYQFDKNDFGYTLCTDCGTLFQSPRPHPEAFEQFYRNSVSSRYWADEFMPIVAEARRQSIFRVRVESLANLCNDKDISVNTLIDVGAGSGIFLEEWRQRFQDTRCVGIEPSVSLAQRCKDKGLDVIESIVERAVGYEGSGDVVTCFEVFEHVHHPLDFLCTLKRLIRPGGYLFITALGVDGFDIQVLWEKSNSIFPPHHINFLSVEGFHRLFERAGFVDVDITTPGALDVDIVRNAAIKDASVLSGQRFIQRLVQDSNLSMKFQEFLRKESLSSHTWVYAKNSAA